MITKKITANRLRPVALGLLMLGAGPALANNDCVTYAVASAGGQGGFRMMHNDDSFRRINDGGRVEGKICNRASVRIELSKRNLDTKVGMKINDKRYQFPAGDSGNKRVNGWYRKYFTVNLK